MAQVHVGKTRRTFSNSSTCKCAALLGCKSGIQPISIPIPIPQSPPPRPQLALKASAGIDRGWSGQLVNCNAQRLRMARVLGTLAAVVGDAAGCGRRATAMSWIAGLHMDPSRPPSRSQLAFTSPSHSTDSVTSRYHFIAVYAYCTRA